EYLARCVLDEFVNAAELVQQCAGFVVVADGFAEGAQGVDAGQAGEAVVQMGAGAHAAAGQGHGQGVALAGDAALATGGDLVDDFAQALDFVEAQVGEGLEQQVAEIAVVIGQRLAGEDHDGLVVLLVVDVAADVGVAVDAAADAGLPGLDFGVAALANAEFGYAGGVVGQHGEQVVIEMGQFDDNLLVGKAVGALAIEADRHSHVGGCDDG